MLDIKETKDGCIVSVKVQPKASTDRIIGEYDGGLKIAVTSAPEKGKANKSLIDLVARKLSIPGSRIEIISGKTFKNKILKITGVGKEKINRLVRL